MAVKKILVLIGLLLIGLVYFDQINLSPEEKIKEAKKPKHSEQPLSPTVIFNDKTYAYGYFSVYDLNSLQIINNLTKKEDSTAIIQNNRCQAAVNGGFYTAEFKPLGLLVINKKIIQEQTDSGLLNGFLSVDLAVEIATSAPNKERNFLIQAGPILIFDQQPLTLNLTTDKFSRRIVAAVNDQSQLVLLVVYDQNSLYSGPKLIDLPPIVQKIGQQEKLKIVSAINLDGGSASMFKNEKLYLSEYKTVGEVICIK